MVSRESALSKVTFLLPLLAYVAVFFIDGSGFHPSGDGYYSWIFARSLAFDGDFDFTNDYALCGDPFEVGNDRGTGHLDNPFYIGPAAAWTAPLFVFRILATLLTSADVAARSSCGGWLTALTLLMGPLAGALAVWFSYRAAALLTRAPTAAFSALLFAFSSPIFPYSTSAPHYSHVYLTALTAALTYVSLRISLSGPRPRDAWWLALLLTLTPLHRLPAALYAALPAAACATSALRRRPFWKELSGALAGSALGIGLTFVLYEYLYGTYFALPQGPHYVHFAHAHPWLLLFGVQGGFFFWMPAAWLSVFGLALALRRGDIRLFSAGCLAAAAAEVFISSTPLDWFGNWSLGARRLLPLVPFVIVFASLALEPLGAWLGTRWRWTGRAAALVVVLALVNNIIASTTIRGDRQLTQRELYGAISPLRPLWSLLDAFGVDIALLPAEWYFAARYHLPTDAYREAITPRYYRNYRTLEFENTNLDLGQPSASRVAPGAKAGLGLEVSEDVSRVVFTGVWPFVTHAQLVVTAERGAVLHMEHGSGFASRTPIGRIDIPAGADALPIELPVPPNAYDSGLNEWLFRAEGGHVVIRSIALDDRTPRVPLDSTSHPKPAP
ncbi:hypothetical protein [Pendulispora albinea]|uniref:Glycosyltransferase RgtA/B/C/D-like domain-containing protein n=1 Tax=Pendulispora albinea TaxID=2741071 RepID=A0ABZ2LZU5_9BACT